MKNEEIKNTMNDFQKHYNMDIYKEFIQLHKRKTLENVYLYIIQDTSPKLKNYVRLICDVPFIDGAYHTYYGEIKTIVNSFMTYFNLKTDEMVKEADRLINNIDKHELIDIIQQTISIHQTNQIDFGKEYLPVLSAIEKKNYDEIEEKYNEFMEKLFEFTDELEKMDRKSKIDEFAKGYFQIPIGRTCEILKFVEDFVSMMLVDRLKEIRTSIEEIALRLRNNLREIKKNNDSSISKLVHQLYDKNKEHITINRQYRKCSTENNEVLRGMVKIRDKIERNEESSSLQRLEEEMTYWDKRIEDFNKIVDTITKLKAEEESVSEQEKIYNSMRTIELPGTKRRCWENMGENISERKEYLKRKMLDAARALRTYFTCRGIDRIYYVDNIGPYYVDEFNHQVYVSDYAMEINHKDCAGNFRAVTDKEKYYFDERGRYVLNNDEKLYECASCTSQYKLGEDLLLNKTTEDCGHSEIKKESCKLDIKDPNVIEMFASAEPVNIHKTLDSEVVKYLWDSFGAILTEALHDVALAKPENPIHYLAHKLLYHKYTRTENELRDKYVESDNYRTNIYKNRHEKAVAASLAWKSKQVKHRKPEESDDTQNIVVYDSQIAQQNFINIFNYYD